MIFSERKIKSLPSAIDSLEEIAGLLTGRRSAVFLDYDGTLTPIVARPEIAVISPEMRRILRELSQESLVAVISGRDLPDVRALVGIPEIFYAGSHGMDIAGPKDGEQVAFQQGSEFLTQLDNAEQEIRARSGEIVGLLVERKRFSISVHYREVEEQWSGRIEEFVKGVLSRHPALRRGSGKKLFEILPGIDWSKGKALLWMLHALKMDPPDVVPIYIGDDFTDEDAFRVVQPLGLGIVVEDASGERDGPTAALYRLEDTDQVRDFLKALTAMLRAKAARG